MYLDFAVVSSLPSVCIVSLPKTQSQQLRNPQQRQCASVLKAGMRLISQSMNGWLVDCGWIKVQMSRKKDLLGGHQQPTTKRKTEGESAGTKSPYWLEGVLNIAWSLDWTSVRSLGAKQPRSELAAHTVTVAAAVGRLYPCERVKLKERASMKHFAPISCSHTFPLCNFYHHSYLKLYFSALFNNTDVKCSESLRGVWPYSDIPQWSWGKHPPSCQKPRCPSPWHWNAFSGQRETDWANGERIEGAKQKERVGGLLLGEKNEVFQGLKVFYSRWTASECLLCIAPSWLISGLSGSAPPQPTDWWPSMTSHCKSCFLRVLYLAFLSNTSRYLCMRGRSDWVTTVAACFQMLPVLFYSFVPECTRHCLHCPNYR